MDLELSLSYKEQNDNEAIVFTDDSNYGQYGTLYSTTDTITAGVMYQITADGGHGSFTGAGSASTAVGSRFICTLDTVLQSGDECMEVTPFAREIIDATLDITITDSSNDSTTYTTINLYADFGPFTSQSDLEYTIDKSYLGGSNGDELTDGIYAIKYNVEYRAADQSDSTSGKPDELSLSVLVDGVIKAKVYDKLRQIPTSYDCNDCDTSEAIKEADFAFAYLSAIEQSAYTAKTQELVLMLSTLESIVTYDSSIIL